jgi:hypothetical protein
MIGKDDVFLGPVVPEEGRAAETSALGDVIHGRLLVTALVEQVERGLREPVMRRWLAHDRPSSLLHGAAATCGALALAGAPAVAA